MIDGKLTVWTIFTHPADLPDVPFVVKCEVITPGAAVDTGERWLRKTLAEAREVVRGNDPTADTRMSPAPGDVPCLVESWV